MKSLHFEHARAAYEKGDYVEALKEYYACLKEDSASFEPGDTGLVYYRLGNCLLKMRNFQEAGATYQKALEDPDFTDASTVRVNLGRAQVGAGNYEAAIVSYNAVLADPSYQKPYQAQMGLGTAFSRLGMTVDAGTAYRNAALDARNPKPIKALIQLGACFNALGRPQDALESYKAALDFNPEGSVRSKVYESLGLAYTVCGQYPEAIEAFTTAVNDGRYALSADALESYQQAQLMLAQQTGADAQAASYTALQTPTPIDNALQHMKADGYGAGNVPLASNTDFFSASDDDLISMGKEQMKSERKRRNLGLKILLIIMIILVLVIGAGIFCFWQGYGIPSQQTVATEMFAAHANGEDVLQYWAATDGNEIVIDQKMNMVAPTSDIEIIYLDAHMAQSEAIVSVTLEEGGTIEYSIKFERVLFGWKVSDVSLYYASQQ